MKAGIVTDDFTGGNDIAGRFAAAGWSAYSSLTSSAARQVLDRAETVVLNARSRFLKPGPAREASRAAWRYLLKASRPPEILFQKIDSTLRGNPASEMEGLILESGHDWMAVVPAYPAMGRQTKGGSLLVHGMRLDRTEYAVDPLSPARNHRVDRLFAASKSRHIFHRQVGKGVRFLTEILEGIRRRDPGIRFVTFDCLETAHLDVIADACLSAGCRAFGGASGLAGSLARKIGPGHDSGLKDFPGARRLLGLAGTLSQTTLDQLERAQSVRQGSWVHLGAEDYIPYPAAIRGSLLELCQSRQKQSGCLWLSTVRRREEAWEALKIGKQRGLAGPRVAQNAMQALARLAGNLLTPGTAVLLTGGHTAETFFASRGLPGSWIGGELLPGLPWGEAPAEQGRRLLVLSKPGGFGGPDLLVRAARKLLNL